MLSADTLDTLRSGRNLLAFSGGGDSTALFFLLLEAGIDFDIALVNYHTRSQSDEEAAHALLLAQKHGLRCYIHDTSLPQQNFEHEARTERYAFFESLIAREGYANLLTAHQLDDRLEWLLMQLCKGAGMPEMVGMEAVENRGAYRLVRPLLQSSKAELRTYLEQLGQPWFEDASNRDEHHRRNFFRSRFAEPMLERYTPGIKKSFAYLDEDRRAFEGIVPAENLGALWWFKTPPSRRAIVDSVDRALKQAGFLMRQGDRERLKEESTLVVGRRYVVAIATPYTFIAPYEERPLEKTFKERCRKLEIEPKMRPYLFRVPEAFERVALLLGDAVDPHGE